MSSMCRCLKFDIGVNIVIGENVEFLMWYKTKLHIELNTVADKHMNIHYVNMNVKKLHMNKWILEKCTVHTLPIFFYSSVE